MAERRYAESEVREIFALATSGKLQRAPASPATSGHTLADLQSIAREVGIDPDVVARAAAALDARPPSAPRRSWGMPIEVGRIARLQRNLTDDEWDRLVAALRSTFGARGKVHVQGGLREWSNGNLRAAVEPAEDGGYRLRLGTLKGDAAGINALGLAGIATGAIAAGSLALSGDIAGAAFVGSMLGGGGIAAFITNFVRLPRWARRRDRQMEEIAALAERMTRE